MLQACDSSEPQQNLTDEQAEMGDIENEFSGVWGKWQQGYNPQNAQARTMHLNASVARIQAKLHARANKTSTSDGIDEKDGDSSPIRDATGEVIASSTQECAAAEVCILSLAVTSFALPVCGCLMIRRH